MPEKGMNLPPESLSNAPVKEYTAIDHRHTILDSAILEVAGAQCGPAKYLAICRDEAEKGFYLFYCSENWEIWNDLWFEDVSDAKDYIEKNEYAGTTPTWEQMT